MNEVKKETLKTLLTMIKALRRGCDCEYDYRCGNCQRITDIMELGRLLESENTTSN